MEYFAIGLTTVNLIVSLAIFYYVKAPTAIPEPMPVSETKKRRAIITPSGQIEVQDEKGISATVNDDETLWRIENNQ